MKLVIDKIGIPGDYTRRIVNLDNIAMLTLAGSGDNEQLLVTFADGRMKAYNTNDNQFGLPDGHGDITCTSPQEVMNAYLELDMKGTDDEWVKVAVAEDEDWYQNRRCSSVFKHVYSDGTVKYTDNDYVVCFDDDNGYAHSFGLLSDEVYSRWPITFPYMPSEKPFKVYDRTFDSVNAEQGCFDTVACLRIEEPDGTVHAVNKFWKEAGDHFEEITKEEYDLRLESYTNKLAEKGDNV